MTRAEQPTGATASPDDALAAESRERAVGALLRFPPLRRLWSAQFLSSVGDVLSLLALVLLAVQAATVRATGGDPVLGGGYRGTALAVACVLGVRLLATLLFGAVLLGPLSTLLAPGKGVLDRRWTMFGADILRVLVLVVAPLWIDWVPGGSMTLLLVTVFVLGGAERVWAAAKDSAAPGLLPAAPPEAVRTAPDQGEALRRLWLRTGFVALPVAAAGLVAVTLVSNLLGVGILWFHTHQAALACYVAAGLFAASLSVVHFLSLPDGGTTRLRSPIEGLRPPRLAAPAQEENGKGRTWVRDKGRTGALPLLVLACGSVATAIAAATGLAVLHAADLGGGPVTFGLLVLALTGGTAAGIRLAPHFLPSLSRRRLLALALALTGGALLLSGLVPDTTTVVMFTLLAGVSAGLAANTGHALIDQETEEDRRPRTTGHLQAVVRAGIALGGFLAPVLAALIGPHRIHSGAFLFAYGGAAFTLLLAGALLLPVGALVLGRTDDRQGVPLRRDLRDALGAQPRQAPAADGFFIALEGGDGAGKSTQIDALAEWIRAKGHEVVVTKEPGATPVGKRLRSILLDVSSAGLSPRAEALLYAADRAEHIDSIVRPALERGAVVLSDRYIDSSVAYQGAGRDLSPSGIARISRWATDGLVPHLTVLLDIAPDTARERFTEAPDRLESEPPEFHERVRSGFLTLAAADPARYLVVDAGQDPEDVTTVIRHRLDAVLPFSESEAAAHEEARHKAEEEARRRAEEEAARKAEEKRQEQERKEEMARLRAEEKERRKREEELERQRAEARKAELAREKEEAERRRAEEERERREAEERTRREEIERQRKLAEEETRLRAEAEERRREKQRRAEEALFRAEADAQQGADAQDAQAVSWPGREGAAAAGSDPDGSEADTTQIPRVDPGSGPPPYSMRKETDTGRSPYSLRKEESDAERTAVLPQAGGEADATAHLPRVTPDDGDRTREIPQAEPRSSRPDWAEETPMDDLPSLADELLGPHEDDDRRR